MRHNHLVFVTILVCSFMGVVAAFPQTPLKPSQTSKTPESETEKERQLRRDRDVQNLIIDARSLPVEISADLLFELLKANIVADVKRRREIQEDLFSRSSEAKEPYKRTYREGLIDTREGYQTMAYDLQLDMLSIRLRIVNLMIPHDKARARQMFQEIPKINPPVSLCEDALDYDLSEFYTVLRSIFQQTYDSDARRRMEPTFFASNLLSDISSPAQIRPAMTFLMTTSASTAEIRVFLDSFVMALRKIPPDPRSFAFSVKNGALTNEMRHGLIPNVEKRGLSADELVRAYRTFLAKQLSAIQCRDTLMVGTAEKPHPIVAEANQLFKTPLDAEDVRPEKVEPGAKSFAYWRSPKAAKLLAGVKRLRFGDGRIALTTEEQSRPEWQQALIKFLEEFDAWHPDDEETESDYLHQRGVIYYSLIDLAPPGIMRGIVLRDYAMFLRDSKMWKDSPAQWLVYAKHILRMGKTLKGKEHDEFKEILTGAGNHVFPLYFELERLRPTSSPPK